VFAGDTVYPALEIDELAGNRTTGVVGFKSTIHNQRRELVLDGRQRYLLRRRPNAADQAENLMAWVEDVSVFDDDDAR
jgi:hypothetical protein